MNFLKLRFNPIIQSLILAVLILFMFNYINEKPFIKLYKWPNFGDNYIAGLIFVSLFLVTKSLIKFNRSDYFFFALMIYIALIETFYFQSKGLIKFVLLRDLFAVFYAFKILSFIEITNKIEKIIKYSSWIFIFLSAGYFTIYLSLHHYEFKFDFINYTDPSLRNNFFFQIFFLFMVCAFFRFHKLSILFYFISALILFYFPSRAQLIVFLIVIVPILFNFKFRIILLIAHFIFVYFVYFAEYKKSVKHTLVQEKTYVETVAEIKKKPKLKDNEEITRLDTNHGAVNSTITRLFHIKENAKRLKKNFILGSGYASLIQNKYKLISRTCECLLLHPLLAYGILGQVFMLIFVFFLYKDYKQNFTSINSKLFLISTILLFIVYSIPAPLLPAWFSLGFFLAINLNKYEIHDKKLYN